jgi:2-polyprenyl-6-methoxyphenol hydroxylase-like FAD-dependent oxidoreductase
MEEVRMSNDERQPQGELTPEELEAQDAAELPDREAMSLINANIAIPINAAIAANVLSDGAVAWADAAQNTPIDQSQG